MGRKYRFHDQDYPYFVTMTVVNWIDIFTRDEYRQVIVDSLRYSQQNKGLVLHAWVVMTNHVHLIIGREDEQKLEDIMRDLKSYTSRRMRLLLESHPNESRRSWMMWMFTSAGKHRANNKDWQFWQQHNHPIELSSDEMITQRLNYLHDNPVRAGFVAEAHHWLWSSAYDYMGGKGMLDVVLID